MYCYIKKFSVGSVYTWIDNFTDKFIAPSYLRTDTKFMNEMWSIKSKQ